MVEKATQYLDRRNLRRGCPYKEQDDKDKRQATNAKEAQAVTVSRVNDPEPRNII